MTGRVEMGRLEKQKMRWRGTCANHSKGQLSAIQRVNCPSGEQAESDSFSGLDGINWYWLHLDTIVLYVICGLVLVCFINKCISKSIIAFIK